MLTKLLKKIRISKHLRQKSYSTPLSIIPYVAGRCLYVLYPVGVAMTYEVYIKKYRATLCVPPDDYIEDLINLTRDYFTITLTAWLPRTTT